MANNLRNTPAKFLLLGEIATRLAVRIKGDSGIRISGVSSLENAGPHQLSFLTDTRYSGMISQCKAAALIVPPSFGDLDYPLLISDQPYLALAKAAQLFHELPFLEPGVHESACLGECVQLGEDVRIGPLAHAGSGCSIGSETRVYARAYLGNEVKVGEGCLIYPGATVLDGCRLGNRVTIHSGTVIGSDGFGYAQDERGHHVKIPQVGIVQIDDDVEIGANCTIDRATFGRTWIQRGAKIDNLVQIAHNVVVGEHSILISQVGVSGSTQLGKHVILAGQVGVVGHIQIGDRVRVGAKSGVGRSVKAGEDVSGIPAVPHREWLKVTASIRHLPRFREELRQLKAKIQELEEALHRE